MDGKVDPTPEKVRRREVTLRQLGRIMPTPPQGNGPDKKSPIDETAVRLVPRFSGIRYLKLKHREFYRAQAADNR
jgi:hypothetical protein